MKFFISRLAIVEGNSGAQHFDQALFVAKDEAQATSLNQSRASLWAGDDGEEVVGGAWRFHSKESGTFRVTPHAVLEISPTAFEDLKDWFPVFGDRKTAELEGQEPTEAVKTLARRIGDQLGKHDTKVGHSKLLHAVAASLGSTNWQVLKHADSSTVVRTEETRSAVRDAVAEALSGVYYCERVWSAWQIGTMTEDDFTPAGEVCEVVDEITDAAWAALKLTRRATAKEPSKVVDGIVVVRKEVIDEIVDDVRSRARKFGFSHSGMSQATRLAEESAEVLDLDATEVEICAAAIALR